MRILTNLEKTIILLAVVGNMMGQMSRMIDEGKDWEVSLTRQ